MQPPPEVVQQWHGRPLPVFPVPPAQHRLEELHPRLKELLEQHREERHPAETPQVKQVRVLLDEVWVAHPVVPYEGADG